MDSRKRPRLLEEESLNDSLPAGHSSSIYLTATNDVGGSNDFPPHLLLTICDDDTTTMSNGGDVQREYLIDGNEVLAHIKQEHDIAQQQQQQSPYHIVTQRQLSALPPPPLAHASAMLPTAVQLPSGCEIYLVKEYVEPAVGSASRIGLQLSGAASPLTHAIRTLNNNNNNNKDALISRVSGGIAKSAGVHIMRKATADSAVPTNAALLTTPTATGGAPASAAQPNAGGVKRSYLLETTYKKRDDKRRVTHNEVERRRRDKINSWIFKLKEMLPPAEIVSSSQNNRVNNNNSSSNSFTNGNAGNNNNNNNGNNQNAGLGSQRPPPNDSKSQILIKACEYIRAMQDEMQRLRECLTENENLRLCNQRLEHDLTKLKMAYARLNQAPHNSTDKFSLNGLELLPIIGDFDGALLLTATTTAAAASTGSNSNSPACLSRAPATATTHSTVTCASKSDSKYELFSK